MSFQLGRIYLLFCNYTDPQKPKFAICVCDRKPLFLFINSEPRKFPDKASQVPVSPKELNFLDYESYIDTSNVLSCLEGVSCKILKNFPIVPKTVADRIKKAVRESSTLAGRHIATILRNL